MVIFPNDANGDALRRMEAEGDDLTIPWNIDFNVVFPDGGAAEEFAKHFRALGHEVSVEAATEIDQDFPWDVVVVKHMAPSYGGVSGFESLLQSVADCWGGHNDGWGCFSEPSST
ncbi:MAG: ribonuclease E inhibitor RraB [Candidatus Acidiferrum sp.]